MRFRGRATCVVLTLAGLLIPGQGSGAFGRTGEPATVASTPRTLERDLGQGLVYYRVHVLPADLPDTDPAHKQPCVLDLRYARGDKAAATLLAAWLKGHGGDRNPVFVLVNGSTAVPLLAELAHRATMPGILVVGVAAQRFEPDIMVNESPRDERRAYDALEHGETIAELTTDHPDKVRNDEASLAHDRSTDTESDDSTSDEADAAPAAKPTEPPIDAALQRAIQLDRGLRALGRL